MCRARPGGERRPLTMATGWGARIERGAQFPRKVGGVAGRLLDFKEAVWIGWSGGR